RSSDLARPQAHLRQVLSRGAAALAEHGRLRPRTLDRAPRRGRPPRPHRVRKRARQGHDVPDPPEDGREAGALGRETARRGRGGRLMAAAGTRDREKILIVEDDASILKGLKMNLELEGYAVLG